MPQKRKSKSRWQKLAKRVKRAIGVSKKKEEAKPLPTQWYRENRNLSWYDDDGDYVDAE
jgi:hypothetical protein